ncbi:MAG: hypothetical protein CME62_15785 [Halobacteriovoraceae bacterium]|nr:hypothetical protein [Halobacteriovoraceae bacterium]|tara:strand:+ start:9011 stop:9664 length:654 start_codon:yes stop_codon:yes gene_type:complete
MSEKNRLLLVEDDNVSGQFLRTKLKERGFEVDLVLDFEAKENLNLEQYDLILLDIMMPNLSGTEILNRLRKKFNRFELPIIMVTSKDESASIVEALKLGANDYVTKPVNIEIAIARIQTQLQIKKLLKESLKAKQMSTMSTMVATLNHEINNPLAIAVGNLSIPFEKIDEAKVKKSLAALNRVADITKKIAQISEQTSSEVSEESYGENGKIFKIEG